MASFRQHLMTYFTILFLFLCIVYSSQNTISGESNANENKNDHHNTLNYARVHFLKSILNRRALYDPAYADAWSSYFEKKRAVFDPAYDDWSNRFK